MFPTKERHSHKDMRNTHNTKHVTPEKKLPSAYYSQNTKFMQNKKYRKLWAMGNGGA